MNVIKVINETRLAILLLLGVVLSLILTSCGLDSKSGQILPIPPDSCSEGGVAQCVENRIDVDADGYTSEQGDCNDENADIHPGIAEIPYDGIDNDCNAETKDGDLDGDGVSLEDGDCNDSDLSVFPGAEEKCDEVDHNCDGRTRDNLYCFDPLNPDQDGDGYCGQSNPIYACDPIKVDCNDLDPEMNPGLGENCTDNKDNDCDGIVDDPVICDCEVGQKPPCA